MKIFYKYIVTVDFRRGWLQMNETLFGNILYTGLQYFLEWHYFLLEIKNCR